MNSSPNRNYQWIKQLGGCWQHYLYPMWIESLPNGFYSLHYEVEGEALIFRLANGSPRLRFLGAKRAGQHIRQTVYEKGHDHA